MTASDLLTLSIADLAAKLRNREVSPVEVTQAALERAERLQSLGTFIKLMPEAALEQARRREEAIGRGDYRGPLDGVPVGIKDNIALAGVPCTAGSLVYADYVPSEDAFAVQQYRDAGAVILGKENMHELAAGGTSDNPHFGTVRNPWNTDHIPAGSSGGAAANVAACITFASLGTDIGGSVRTPAAYCGIVGVKATFGRVSQRGLVATTFHGDHIGPMARSVADAALALQALAGHDPLDPASIPMPVPDFSADLGRGIAGLTVGVPTDFYFDGVDSEVIASTQAAIAQLAEMGAEVREVPLPTLRYFESLQIDSMAEAFVLHEELLKTRRDRYTPELAQRFLAGQFVRAVDHVKSLRAQRLAKEEFARAFHQVDVIAAPTTLMSAPRIDAGSVTIDGVEHEISASGNMVLYRNAFPANFTGLPALSVPCGFAGNGIPLGLQLIARPFEETLLLRVAAAYEQVSPAARRLPPLATQA